MLRVCDLVLAVCGLVFSAPLLLVIYVLGQRDGGSALFFQTRVGQNGRPFTLVKFRTMRPGTTSVATHLADAAAITKLGHFLRRSKIDELPQLWNVLRGQMSLVGPRPCLPTQHELIAARQALGVLAARPGITGLAQVQGIDMSQPRRLAEIDAQMLRNMNLGLYLCLLMQTVRGAGAGDRVRVG